MCNSPPKSTPEIVLLQASEDGQGFSDDTIYFIYMGMYTHIYLFYLLLYFLLNFAHLTSPP